MGQLPGLPSLSTVGSLGVVPVGGGWSQAAAGGAWAWSSLKTPFQIASHLMAHGQYFGMCKTGRRCGRASRAGTWMIWRRRVAPRATAGLVGSRVSAARSRLWVIAAQIAHAWFDANRPEGRWANGPSIRSAKTVSMTACRRWVTSAAVTDSTLLVKNGW